MRETVLHSLRSLRRSPGFVAIATLSLGAALGLSTSVFALIDAMRHPESAYRDVGKLYGVRIFVRGGLAPSRREIEDALKGIREVERVATYRPAGADVDFGDGVEARGVAYTRPGFFELLGVRPRLGHLPTANDAASARVAMVSDAVWLRKFENRPRIGDAKVTIEDEQFSVIGVMPNGTSGLEQSDVWIPDPTPDARRPDGSDMGVPVVRLRRGDADTTQVNAQIKGFMGRFTQTYVAPRGRPFAARLVSLRPDPLELKDFHRAMIGASLCVLLIACANVAALMLARGVVRRRDYALRLALGAGRAEIAREVIVEVAVLAVAGCLAGAIVATWAVGLITRATPEGMRYLGFVQPQWSLRVLAMSAFAVFVSVAIAGGFPAWQAGSTDPAGLLKEASGGNTGRAGTRFRWLVMAELALSMMLLVGASLMVKSARLMARYDFGYDARSLLDAATWLQWRDSSSVADKGRMFADALSRFRAMPNVRGASMIMGCSAEKDVVTTDRTVEGGVNAYIPGACTNASSDFFHTLGVTMIDGRDFVDGDAAGGGAVILDQKTAHRLFPHESAVGRTLKLGDFSSAEPWLPVVGVVRDQPLTFPPFPEAGPDTNSKVYASLPVTSKRLAGWRHIEFIIRPASGAAGVSVAVTRALRASLPPRSFSRVDSWLWNYEASLRAEQFLSLLFSLLGLASLALGAAGLFSVVSYITSQRMREFAVRVALGATSENVLRLVMRDAVTMALGGTAVGAGLGMWAGFLLWDKMWGVYPVDAGALVGAELLLLLVTLLACLGPALRAGRADPVDVMRAT
jgi:predicted permease